MLVTRNLVCVKNSTSVNVLQIRNRPALLHIHTSEASFSLIMVECWTVNKADVVWIDTLDQWCLRRILGFKWSDFVRNEDVRHATQQPPLSSVVKTRRLSLFGHIAW